MYKISYSKLKLLNSVPDAKKEMVKLIKITLIFNFNPPSHLGQKMVVLGGMDSILFLVLYGKSLPHSGHLLESMFMNPDL